MADDAPQTDPPAETTIRSRVGFGGRMLTVRVDDVRLPSGRESGREVVEHPGAVAIVAVTDDARVLLVRQHRHAVGRALLEIPAGTREPGEDPAATARRELIEETGYAAAQLTVLTEFFASPGYTTERLWLFMATGCRPVAGQRDAEEPAALEPVPLADLATVLPGIEDAKTLVGLLWLMRGESP